MSSRSTATEVAHRLTEAGHVAYFAGGCVRDRLLGIEPVDHDIATSATPAQVLGLFPRANHVGAHFGVMIVRSNDENVEVATFRTDGSYRDGRRPESVEFSTPEEDAARRDFTVNGLFEHPDSGEIIDFVGGLSDLRQRRLRAIGDPEARFTEDALRLLRAVRFSASLDFTIDPDTWAAVRRLAPTLQRIAPERIRGEFSRILTHPTRARGLDGLAESGLLAEFLPEAVAMIGCEQPPEWHPEGDVYTHTRIMLDMLGPGAPLALCLAVLLHDIGKPPTRTWDPVAGRIRFNGHDAVGAEMAREILGRLRYPKRTIEEVAFVVSRHMQFMNVQQMRIAKLKRFMSAESFPLELELHRVDCASSNGFTDNLEFLIAKREEFQREPIIPKPLLTGRDLIALGLKPGPRFKEILDAAMTEQLEGQLGTRDEALAWLRRQ